MTHPKHQLAGWNPFKDIDRAARSVIKSPALRVIADPAGVFRSGGPASIREVTRAAEDFGREVVDLDIALHTAPVSAITGESANPFQNSPPAPVAATPAPQPQPMPAPQPQPSPAPAPVVISPVVIPPSMNDAQPRPVPSSPPVITSQPAPTYGPPSGALYVADVSNVGAPGAGVAVPLPGASQAADTPNNAGKWLAALAAAVMFLN